MNENLGVRAGMAGTLVEGDVWAIPQIVSRYLRRLVLRLVILWIDVIYD